MTIHTSEDGGVLVFALEGRLDTGTAPQLQKQLIPEAEAGKAIRLDFEQVAYVSSAGLRVLLLAQKAAAAAGGRLDLVNVAAEIQDIFEMTGFSGVLHIEPGAVNGNRKRQP